jgi:hypothetical protein
MDFHRLDRASLRLAHSFDHFAGADQQGGWYSKAECSRGLEIND